MYPFQRNVMLRHEEAKTAPAGITRFLQTEEALRSANARLRLLSAITRHDINNQLMALTGYIELMQAKHPSLAEELGKAGSAAERIASMIRFTREYEDIGACAPGWHYSRALVYTALAQMTLGSVKVKNEIPAGLEILADPLITRVLYNLMDNAVRYGGKITTIRFTVGKIHDEMVLVCEDDGEGVPAAEKGRIFDRGVGKNTGMGLFLAREILSITGIRIRETGEPGHGARFEMIVPDNAWRLNRRGIVGTGIVRAGYFMIPVPGR